MVITYTTIATPLGPMNAAAVPEGICLLEFSDRPALPSEWEDLKRLFHADVVEGDSPHFTLLRRELGEYFGGRRRTFTVPLVLEGTPFQKKAWEALLKIPSGKTSSYGEQARVVGDSDSVRAVARANGQNRIAILVPCHRVIGADGSLVGYGGGLHRKQKLLEIEGALSGQLDFTDSTP